MYEWCSGSPGLPSLAKLLYYLESAENAAPLFSLSILHALKIRDCYALSVRNDRQGPSKKYVRLALKNLGGTLNPIQSTVLNSFHSNQTGTFNPPCSKKNLLMS